MAQKSDNTPACEVQVRMVFLDPLSSSKKHYLWDVSVSSFALLPQLLR